MQKKILVFAVLFSVQASLAQQYSIVIKNGFLIDPKNHLSGTFDIGISNGKIISLKKNIDASKAEKILDAKGLYVVPGLIDIHTHVFYGTANGHNYCNGRGSLLPDNFTFRSGITTIVDAGSSGWRNFDEFRQKIIDRSQTRVFAFLNIVGNGMRGSRFEQDTADMNAFQTSAIAKKFHSYIVGVKVAHYQMPKWFPVDEAVKAATIDSLPVMVDFGGSIPNMPIEELFSKHLRNGDIFTHCFAQLKSREPIVDANTKTLKPFIFKAQKKGIAFDVGYGKISFDFSQAIPAIHNGFYPNSISTDMQNIGASDSVKNILNIMSKFLALGMKLSDVIAECTSNPAKEIKHEELGQLSEGSEADVTILNLKDGQFSFYDHKHNEIKGIRKLECVMTIKGGKIVYSNPGGADN